jgi:hypothetical protein
MLRHPCTRNKATAQLLLERAAEQTELTPAEREACRNLADDLDSERPDPTVPRTPASTRPAPGLRTERRGSTRSIRGRRVPAESREPR